MVSTHLKNICQIGSFLQVGVNIKNIWNHHLVISTTHSNNWGGVNKDLPMMMKRIFLCDWFFIGRCICFNMKQVINPSTAKISQHIGLRRWCCADLCCISVLFCGDYSLQVFSFAPTVLEWPGDSFQSHFPPASTVPRREPSAWYEAPAPVVGKLWRCRGYQLHVSS